MISNISFCVKRNFSSALYITGDKAHKTFAVLTPIIDFEKQLVGRNDLIRNIDARKLPIDLQQLEKKWQFFRAVDDRKKILELTRTEIGRMISELMKDVDKNKNDIDALKLHSKLVKDDIKNIKDYWYGLEEDTMLQILNLPNILHKKTPLENITIYATQDCIKEKSKSHMEIAEEYRYVEYFDPLTCYLKSDAALFELGILNYFRDGLSRTGFTQFSNSNFCRSVVLEGCGDNYEKPLKAFTLEEVEDSRDDINRLHLCGGASLYAFMAYFTRNLLQQTHFPLRYFSLGKKYQPANKNLPNDLFNLSQESALNIFIATLEEDDFLEETTKRVIALYEPLGHHFRLTLLAADKLERSESLRLSIQMYSNYLESYVEVGNISLYDNYLSKRLLFTYNVNKERKYPKIIGGTLLNVPRMLGCVLENSVFFNKDLMTPVIKKHMFC